MIRTVSFSGYLGATVLALTTFVAFGCAPPSGDGVDRPNTLIIWAGERDEGIIPTWGVDYLTHLVFDDMYGTVGGAPQLVTGYEAGPGPDAFTYHLRSDVRWHDGTPFTARDIEFTWRFTTHPNVLHADPAMGTVSAADDTTVVMTRKTGMIHPPSWQVYFPAHLLDGQDMSAPWDWAYWSAPVGYGPYRYARHEPGVFVELEAFDDYYRGRPKIDRIVLKFGGDPLTELMAGNVDIIPGLGPNVQEAAAKDPRFRVYWAPSLKLLTLYWNLAHPILGDVRVRRALTLSIDRAELARSSGYPDEAIARGFWDVPIGDGHLARGDYPDPLPFDPARAEVLLTQAGWTDQDGDGIRERDGTELRFQMLAGGEMGLDVFLQASFRKVGARLDLVPADRAVARERFARGDFDVFFAPGNLGQLWTALAGPDRQGGSILSYDNAEVRRVVALQDSARTQHEREAGLEALWPILHEDLPATFIIPRMAFRVAHRRVKGLRSPDRFYYERFVHELWIEED